MIRSISGTHCLTFKRLAALGGLLGLVALSGCAGPPVQHYTLSTVQSAVAAPSLVSPSAKNGVILYALSDVSVPVEVENLSLVVRQGDGQLLVLSHDRWTGSLSAQLSMAISQAMTQRLGMPPVQKLMADASSSAVSQIQLDVQRFDLVPGQYVALEAVWSVRTPGSKKLLTCYTKLRQPVEVGVLPLVQGQQVNAQALAEQISQALVSQAAPAGARCLQ